jgi:protein-tyrosine phosphatase
MARCAWETGTTTVVCTPHLYEWDPQLLRQAREARNELEAALRSEGIDLHLLVGCEVDLNVVVEVDDATISQLVVDGPSSTNGWKGVIVIETPFHGWPRFLPETIFRLKTSGYTPILAHPERNERVARSPELLDECIRAGAVAQGTAGSLAGPFRKTSLRPFMNLLTRGSLAVLASDGHAMVDYTWSLYPLLEELRGRVSEDHLRKLVSLNPERVLAGRETLPGAPVRRHADRSWWRR